MPVPRPLPAPTPIVLALVCAAAAMLGTAPATPLRVGGLAVWPLAWWVAALAFVASGARARLPGVRSPAAAWIRLAAVVVAAAFLVRRADVALLVAIPALPAHAPALWRLDVSELLMGAVLVLPALGFATKGAVRGPRPGLLVPGLMGLGWVGWAFGSTSFVALSPPVSFAAPAASAGLAALALAWTGTLVTPPALSPPPGRAATAAAAAAPLLGGLLIVLLAGTLLPRAARIGMDLSPLATVGRNLHLPYGVGVHVAAGAEAFLLILAAQVVLSMGMRGACRSLPVLSDRVPILLALGAWLAALWSTEVFLLVMSGALGWATTLLSIGDGVVTAEDRP